MNGAKAKTRGAARDRNEARTLATAGATLSPPGRGRSSAAYLAATSLGTLALQSGSAAAFECKSVSQIPYVLDCSGPDGQYAYSDSNGSPGTASPGGEFTLPTSISGGTQDSYASAVFIDARGGNGGNGADFQTNRNHWGGYGGAGGGLTLNGAGISIQNLGGNGITLNGSGGNGGLFGFGPSDFVYGAYGQGGVSNGVTVKFNNVSISVGGSYAVSITANGGYGAPAAERRLAANPTGVGGGWAGPIMGTMSGNVTNPKGVGLVLQAWGGDGGPGTGDGSHPSGNGGAGGAIGLDYQAGAITTLQSGVHAFSRGGEGGGADLNYQTPGGSGGNGGDVSITIGSGASISTSSYTFYIYDYYQTADGILALSRGGSGGDGGSSGILNPHTGKPGGNGGNGGSVKISNYGSIATTGAAARGMAGISEGGLGGKGGSDSGIVYSSGGKGGKGGTEGDVQLSNYGTITTRGVGAAGILSHSLGGGGAGGGNAEGGISVGGNGGNGGDGSTVAATNAGTIATYGDHSPGIDGLSVGGGGGNGGVANGHFFGPSLVGVSIGGGGGQGGAGGGVTVNNAGGIITTGGANAGGIMAQSIGGGGGSGGASNLIAGSLGINVAVNIGGNGGGGGNGGPITVYGGDKITTTGPNSVGLTAQSVGGGGGNGGAVWTEQLTIGVPIPSSGGQSIGAGVAVSVGGSGGNGGGGGSVKALLGDAIDTTGAGAHGLVAASIGGGGGAGGGASTSSVTLAGGAQLTIGVAVGGSGGGGGGSGGVDVISNGAITTRGDNANAMIAQSIGGGGGVGGNAFAQVGMIQVIPPPEGFLPVTLGGSVAVGGRGGVGGVGGAVSVESDGPLLTKGISSIGILAQSIGGGGGAGGNAQGMTTSTGNGTLSLNIGGHGGGGNHGGTVSVTNTDEIKTLGEHSYAIQAQSIGGGGGNGGSASRLTGDLFSAGLGDTNALISLVRTLRTLNAGDWTPGKFTPSFQASATIGGSGGAAGDGNAVTITNTDSATIVTTGAGAHAIVAQSIGGGGGSGANVSSSSNANLATTIMGALQTAVGASANWREFPETFGGNAAVGGQGGSAGKGGLVTVFNNGSISTNGQNAAGVFAQSIGGGGGNGGSVGRSVEEIVKDLFSDPKVGGTILSIIEGAVPLLRLQGGGSLSLNVGGQGGSAGEAGGVSVSNSGSITTTGAHSPGVFAQAVGGGGGNAGSSYQLFGGQTFNFDINIGRGGGGGGNGGGGVRRSNDSTDYAVVIDHQGSIITNGVDSAGVFAQSIGGGGGKSVAHFGGGFSGSFEPYPLSGQTKLGADGASGHGGNVWATSAGTIKTSGALSHAIMAQSVGGGGGAASLVFTDWTSSDQINLSSDITLGATMTSSASDGGGVTVGVKNAIQTSGALAFGVLAQSVGAGGGYVVSAGDTGPLSSPVKLTLNAAGTARGHGGAVGVTLDSNGGIATSGQNAFGILAQSVGGGGGVAGLTTTPGLITLADTSGQGYNGHGDGGGVTVTVDGRVRTTGDGAAGVVAQSIGGGGGIAGNMAAVSYDLNLIKDAGKTGGAGQGGHIVVNVFGGDTYQADRPGVVTHGANAPAILAMSLGSGAILTDAGLLLKRLGETEGNSGGAIDIDVGKNALVSAQGMNSPAIYAVSAGNSGAGSGGIHRGGDILLTIGQSAQITGGSGNLGAAIATNTTGMTTIVNNGGRISSLGGNAITSSGSTILTNTSGRIAGNVVLGGDASTINNADEFHPGAIVTIGGNGLLTNAGVLGLGMQTRYTTTSMTGRFHQTSDGQLLVNLDYANNKSDRLSVSGESNFGGVVMPWDVANPLKGKKLTIAHFDTALNPTAFTAGVSDDGTTIISHALQLSANRKDVTITPSASFTQASAALRSDQSRIASHLQALWDSGYEGAASIFTPFTKVSSLTAYRNALGNLASDVAHSRAVSQVHESYSFFNGLMSCPTFIDGGTRLREGECAWGRITGNLVNRAASGDDSGYRMKQATYQLGLQKEIATDWFLGSSLSYSSATTTADQNALDVSSKTINAGLAIKRQIGSWLLAAGVRGGYETSEMARAVDLPSFSARAKSSPDTYHLGGRLRASYEIGFRNWYLRPYMDLDINYAYQPGYRETGAGAFDLSAQRASRVSVMTTPSFEIGGRVDLGNMTVRPYAAAGVSFLSNGGWTARTQFTSLASSGVAPFQIETGAPRTYGNLIVGLELVTKKGFELKAEYGLRAAKNYVDQTARLRVAFHF